MDNITQEKVDELWVEAKAEWDQKVAESGRSEQMFICTDKTGFVANFLTEYQIAKETVEARGLVMPDFVQGLSISVSNT